jgi:hypothetical protein
MAFLSPLVLSANLDDGDLRPYDDDQHEALRLIAAPRMLGLWRLLDHRQHVQLPAARHVSLLLVLQGSTSSLSSWPPCAMIALLALGRRLLLFRLLHHYPWSFLNSF